MQDNVRLISFCVREHESCVVWLYRNKQYLRLNFREQKHWKGWKTLWAKSAGNCPAMNRFHAGHSFQLKVYKLYDAIILLALTLKFVCKFSTKSTDHFVQRKDISKNWNWFCM